MLHHGGQTVEVAPGVSVRSRVHEYGGAAYLPVDDAVYVVDETSQRVFRIDAPGAEPVPLSDAPERPRSVRWADFTVTPYRRWLVGVRETHSPEGCNAEVRNELVALATDGSGDQRPVFGGTDFVSSPRLSPDGDKLAWVTWDHPSMPWDSSLLWVGAVEEGVRTGTPLLVAGGPEESVCHPAWDGAGNLYFVSDRTGWWLPYRWDGSDIQALVDQEMQAEFASPQWVFRDYRYCVAGPGRAGSGSDGPAAASRTLACCWTAGGRDHLGLLAEGRLTEIDCGPFEVFSHLWPTQAGFVALAGGPAEATAVVEFDLHDRGGCGPARVLNDRGPLLVGPEWISAPERVSFPRPDGSEAHGLFYPPKNPHVRPPRGEAPPLLVLSHGGPTAAFRAVLDLKGVQFYTTRGFAVVQVDYAGSSGYGRPYRDLLRNRWGVADVEDCVSAADWAAASGRADGRRVAIRGESAGGYTTLCALTFTDRFAVGASYYGIGDAAALATGTHKFESRYCDHLIGPYPETAQTYADRSPALHADKLSTPVILFQGTEDKVVPPEQSEAMAAALAAKGVRHRLLAFEGEGHGFRLADTQRLCMEAELEFFGEVLGFGPPDGSEPSPPT